MSGQDPLIHPSPILSDTSTSEDNVENATNLLDPHLSILHCLENEDKSETILSPSQASMDITISDSWQNVEKTELTEDETRPQSVLSTVTQTQNLNNLSNMDILSSTDTSSTEDLPHELSSPTSNSQNHDSLSSILQQSGTSFDSTSLPNALNTLSHNGSDDTNTNTVTNSFSSSSNSFIMPKLSFNTDNRMFPQEDIGINESNITKKRQMLILGRYGLKFFKSIPPIYQPYFQLPISHDPNDYQLYPGLMIIVKELRELITLLNRISKLESGGPPLIILYDNSQRVQVKNVMKSFSRNELITLYYPPVDIDNEVERGKLFEHVKRSLSLSEIITSSTPLHSSSTSIPGSTSTSTTFATSSKRLTKSGTSLNKRKRKQKKKTRSYRRSSVGSGPSGSGANKPKRWFHYIFNKWVIVGISVTASLGTTYYVTHADKESFPLMNAIFNKLKQAPMMRNIINFFQTKEPEVLQQITCPVTKISLQTPIKCWTNVIKYSFHRVNNFIKDTIIAAANCHDVSFGRLGKLHNWNVDDPNNFITLSYITV